MYVLKNEDLSVPPAQLREGCYVLDLEGSCA